MLRPPQGVCEVHLHKILTLYHLRIPNSYDAKSTWPTPCVELLITKMTVTMFPNSIIATPMSSLALNFRTMKNNVQDWNIV